MDESCEPVLEPRHESDVHDEPREPRDPAGEPHPVRAEDRGAAVHGGHAPEVPVLPRIRFGAASHTISDDASSMQAGLEGNLGNAWQVVVVHHVADCSCGPDETVILFAGSVHDTLTIVDGEAESD